jgi:tetratricopeptide (TPR) repeat protein
VDGCQLRQVRQAYKLKQRCAFTLQPHQSFFKIKAEHMWMKFLTSLIVTIVLAAPAFAQTPAPTAVEGQVKEELDAAARVYREGNFVQAQAHSERALQLDPQNKTALYYVARTIHAQYKPGVDTPENVVKAREAIGAYKRILERIPADDEAYKAIAYLYGAIKENELLRDWLFQRAVDTTVASDKRAEAYVVLASKDWECSFQITELPNHKITTVKRNKATVSYRMPKDRVEFEQAKECANRGLEYANMSIALSPENESAWSYKTHILLELSKLAEMSGDLRQKREFLRQYEEALNETTRLSNRPQPNP